jgi:hypothetical protein
MTGSRVRRFLCSVALAALAVPAAAQWSSDKAPELGPGDYPPEATEERPDARAPDAAPAEGTAADVPQAVQSFTPGPVQAAPIEVDTLGKPEGPPVGTLDASNGGLGDHLWSGSDRARVAGLLDRAPLASTDPVFRDLVRRLVLTKAGAPPGSAKQAFIGLRIQKLLDGGLIEEAGTLAAQASVPSDEDFARLQAEALLLANRASDVCGSSTAARQSAGEVFWMQLRAYCAAVSGDTATAELTKDVLKAQGQGDDAFDTLLDDVLNRKAAAPGPIARPTAMHVFLLQQAALPLPEAVARAMGTPENLLVLRDLRQTPRARFEAAERIAVTGAATTAELKAVADAQDLPLARVATAAADAPNLPFFMGQVLLRRAAAIEPRPEEKSRLAVQALQLGGKAGSAPLAAALQADVIVSLKPSAADRDKARRFARALLLAGRPDAAARWSAGDPVMTVTAAFASHDPARIVAVQGELSAFAASLAKNPPDPDADRATKALLLGLADVLGLKLPQDAKAQAAAVASQMWDGTRPGPGTLRTIEELAQMPDRRGEALLLLLDTCRSIGLRHLAPDATIAFTRLLLDIGETQTAHALAMDALAQFVPPPLPPPATP